MDWQKKIISIDELQPYFEDEQKNSLHAQAKALLAQQGCTWPQLREAICGMDAVKYRPLRAKDYDVLVQFNPRRMISTSAEVDEASIKQRPCFLCVNNLPPEEQGIFFGADHVMLCNPAPVLRDHLVIASRTHTPQAIEGYFPVMLELAEGLGEEWFVLYNGPRCGASAPDHMHFQACARAAVPLFNDFKQLIREGAPARGGAVRKFDDYRINLFALSSREREWMNETFNRALKHLAAVTRTDDEPLLNLLATYQNEQWTVFILPRTKHRPDCYTAEGDKHLTISPAAIDLAGVLVAPQPDHFARITAQNVTEIYEEVTLDQARYHEVFRRLMEDVSQ
jgi:hypothetical protein